MTVKLDHHHRVTAQKIFGHPINHNIKWVEVTSLLERFGEVHESHRGNWAITVNSETISFGPSRAKELTEDQVIRVRHFLQSLGVSEKDVAA
ncbi:MAG: hypothetical protein KGR42_08975 [Acidobacteria bacterium]|jgi:hypothetical protein|nr:hypothetical protein [Acidobacteriota bacterium]